MTVNAQDGGSSAADHTLYDVAVVGGGPSGATAANDLAQRGYRVLLLDRAGRIKPCGGAIPPRLIAEFEIPDSLLVARIASARMVSPTDKQVDMPIDGGFVGMVDRDVFDEWLRARAARSGAERRTGTFRQFRRGTDGIAVLDCEWRDDQGETHTTSFRARSVIGADGAVSTVARQCIPGADQIRYVFAYHEIVRSPEQGAGSFDGSRCDVIYRGKLSPDFYSWIFPHGATTSIGTGSACKGFSLRGSVGELRDTLGLGEAVTADPQAAATVIVEPVECLSVCKRPCTVSITAPGRWTYVYGDVDPAAHAVPLLAFVDQYRATADGLVPWRERPDFIRKGVVARIPPLR